jgi:hypothetical protein
VLHILSGKNHINKTVNITVTENAEDYHLRAFASATSTWKMKEMTLPSK